MANIKDLKPFKIHALGYFIQEQMDVREWNQTDLSEVLGLSVKTVNQLIQGKQAITLETARLLGEAFGQSPQYWMNLEPNYRIRKDGILPV
jgi:HTH-type transcriptional regulator/antitoxin HigA